MKFVRLFQFSLCFIIASTRPENSDHSYPFYPDIHCGYESCPKTVPGKINVHLVPHTHDDVGWLKTVDQYYYGSKTMTQKAGVQYILDSVIQELLKDSNRRFIYVESAFFFKWWYAQSPDLQGKVKHLVHQGRLEFIGGAWSMNDEATTHYQSLIDQFAWGLKKLNDTFGQCGKPRIGWQIDPFGHSREMASIFAQMGFDGLFFARLDYQDKSKRLQTKTPEMIWQASPNLGKAADLFTGILYNHYSAPPGFCFDILCSDEPIIDGKYSAENNVNKRVNDFLSYIQKMSKYYRTNNLMVPMGDDFTYQDANMWYKNIDKLIRYGNDQQENGSDINIFYSTPSCYLKSLYDTNTAWPVKREDFFPYSSDPHAFWTGYFTSRPTLKRYERIGNHFLQVCKQLSALSRIRKPSFERKLNSLREAMGIMQHHDAITGTEKEKIAFDYAKELHEAIEACSANTNEALKELLKAESRNEMVKDLSFENCFNLNVSACRLSEDSNKFMVTVYNPLSHNVSEFIRIPVKEGSYEVKDSNGALIVSQMVPIPSAIKKLPFRFSTALYELVFKAESVSSHGITTFFVSKSDNFKPSAILVRKGRELESKINSEVTIGNSRIRLTFDKDGFLSNFETNTTGKRILRQEFLYYEGAVGNNLEFVNRSSGAYIFRPNNTERQLPQKIEIRVHRGPLVEEIHQKINDWISQVIRVYEDASFAEFEWLVGHIPVEDKVGKEIISRFTSDIKSDGIFFTDSNGREMIKRIRNKRETFEPDLKEKIAGNYYPITTKIALEDKNARLAILTDRAQGGSSIQDGALELMVHRRLLHDDAFGVGEALNEMAFGRGIVARGKHHLMFGLPASETHMQERNLQLRILLPPWIFFSKLDDSVYNTWPDRKVNNVNLLPSLPEHIHLLTLESWGAEKLLIRFEYILEKTEIPSNLNKIMFDIKDILTTLGATGLRETTLDGNQWLSDLKRLEFKPEKTVERLEHNLDADDLKHKDSNKFEILMRPMQIRTFILFCN